LEGELATRGPQVAVLVEVALEVAVYGREEGVETDIEFAFVNEQGVVDVLLNNACTLLVGS